MHTHIRTHTLPSLARETPLRGFGELRGRPEQGDLIPPPGSEWFWPPRPALPLAGCCLMRARSIHR